MLFVIFLFLESKYGLLFFAVCVLLPCGGCCYLGIFMGRLVVCFQLKLKNKLLSFFGFEIFLCFDFQLFGVMDNDVKKGWTYCRDFVLDVDRRATVNQDEDQVSRSCVETRH